MFPFQNGFIVYKIRNHSLTHGVVELNVDQSLKGANVRYNEVVAEDIRSCNTLKHLSTDVRPLMFDFIIEGDNILYCVQYKE